MKKAIVGKKIGMTQVFTDDGRLVPVTVVEAGPCKVVQKKTIESDGYEAVQVGFDTYAENRAKKLVNKPMTGHFKKAGVAPTRYLRELKLDSNSEVSFPKPEGDYKVMFDGGEGHSIELDGKKIVQ